MMRMKKFSRIYKSINIFVSNMISLKLQKSVSMRAD